MGLNYLFLVAPVGSIIALVSAYLFYKMMLKGAPGTAKMQKIASAVRQGALAYIKQLTPMSFSSRKSIGDFIFIW